MLIHFYFTLTRSYSLCFHTRCTLHVQGENLNVLSKDFFRVTVGGEPCVISFIATTTTPMQVCIIHSWHAHTSYTILWCMCVDGQTADTEGLSISTISTYTHSHTHIHTHTHTYTHTHTHTHTHTYTHTHTHLVITTASGLWSLTENVEMVMVKGCPADLY